ncbi:conserved hypothetical protein [Candidatus Magnetomoraceae bacterium gMMP-15]
MKSIQLKSKVGKDGILRLNIPLNIPAQELEVLVIVQEIIKQLGNKYKNSGKEWPSDFFENVVGAWSGDLVRSSQGDYESREEL